MTDVVPKEMRALRQSFLAAVSLHVLAAVLVLVWGPLDRRVRFRVGPLELAAFELPPAVRPEPPVAPQRQAAALSVPEPRGAERPAGVAAVPLERLALPETLAFQGGMTVRRTRESHPSAPDVAGEDRARLAALAVPAQEANDDVGLARPVALFPIRPDYPMEARRAGREGLVVLRIHVAGSGRVTRVEVARSSGHAALDQAAALAVRRGVYSPARKDGRPAPGILELTCIFTLKDPAS
jgi:protein TonB